MSNTFSRRHFLTTAAAGLAFGAAAGAANAKAPLTSLRPAARGSDFLKDIQPPAEALIARAKLNGAVGFTVSDVSSGQMLEEYNGSMGLPPASVAKAMTAAYALHALGPGHHFVTEIVATRGVQNGVVAGDLVLKGGGDPTLDTNALAGLAAALKAAGIREVRGDFLVWGGALPAAKGIDDGQPDHVGYNPAVSGLNLNYNRVHFEWRRAGEGYNVSMDARSDRHRPDVRIARMKIAARDVPVYTYRDAGAFDEWTVARGALGKGGARWLPVRKPELYAGEVFQTFARSHGIALKAPKIAKKAPKGTVLAAHESAPLRIILRDMLKYSTNLTAEVVGMSATTALGGRPKGIKDSAKAMNAWAKERYGLKKVALVDHSGLGDKSRMSASDMTSALLAIRKSKGLKPLLKPFLMRDANRKVMRNHPISVHAKTGTLNFVSGLAGFVDLPDGTELAFAIFTGDLKRRAALTRAQRERPDGAAGWNRRAKALQQALIERWGVLYAG